MPTPAAWHDGVGVKCAARFRLFVREALVERCGNGWGTATTQTAILSRFALAQAAAEQRHVVALVRNRGASRNSIRVTCGNPGTGRSPRDEQARVRDEVGRIVWTRCAAFVHLRFKACRVYRRQIHSGHGHTSTQCMCPRHYTCGVACSTTRWCSNAIHPVLPVGSFAVTHSLAMGCGDLAK